MPTFPFGLPATTVEPETQYTGPKKPVFPGSRAASVTLDPQRDRNTNARKANDLPTGLPVGTAITRDPARDRDTAQTNNTTFGGAFKPSGTRSPGQVDPEEQQARELAVPGVPTGISAVPHVASATVRFTAPASVRRITGYTATSTPGNKTGTGTASPITVSGLTAGTSYTFKVHATNRNGNSAESAASNAVTPT